MNEMKDENPQLTSQLLAPDSMLPTQDQGHVKDVHLITPTQCCTGCSTRGNQARKREKSYPD